MKLRLYFLLMIYLQSVILIAGCSGGAQNLAPPKELFLPRAQATAEQRCDVLLDNASVDVSKDRPPIVILKISGMLTAACSNLQLGVKPPTANKLIEVVLGVATIKDQRAGSGSKPFFIGYPLQNLNSGDYTLEITYTAYGDEQKKKLNFSLPQGE